LDLSRHQHQRVTVAGPDATRPIDPRVIEARAGGPARGRASIALVGAPYLLVLEALGIRRMSQAEALPGRGSVASDPFSPVPRLGVPT
jgi:hypothetical protein